MSNAGSSSTGGQPLACPGCRSSLQVGAGEGGRRYDCARCGGFLCGTAVFRQVAGEVRAGRWWASALSAPPAAGSGYCPFCFNEMTATAVADGHLMACKSCEVVWLDKAAYAAATAGAPAGVPAPAGMSDEGELHDHPEDEPSGGGHPGWRTAGRIAEDILEGGLRPRREHLW